MAAATFTTHRDAGRRVLPFAAMGMSDALRAEIHRRAEALMDEARAALDGAAYFVNFLDAADRPTIDLETDADGEADAIEASAQPVTLAPPPVRAVQQHRPTRRQMRAAYRRNGDPIPANLRGLFGRA